MFSAGPSVSLLQHRTDPVTDDRPGEFIASIYLFVCLCVCLGGKSPAGPAEPGNVAVCQDLLIGVWGRDYKG